MGGFGREMVSLPRRCAMRALNGRTRVRSARKAPSAVNGCKIVISHFECYLENCDNGGTTLKNILPIDVEYVPCDLCGSYDHEHLVKKLDPVTGQEFNLVLCGCGMVMVNPAPKPECIKNIYPQDYHENKEKNTRQYNRMLSIVQASNPPGKRLLDFGCGVGEFMRFAQQRGWECSGADIMKWRDTEDLNIHVGDIQELDFGDETFDIITAWAVLEHMKTPSIFFERARDLIVEDGKLIFVVPNSRAPGMKITCVEDTPRHLWLFSPETAKKYLNEYGFELQRMEHNSRIYSYYPFGLVRFALYKKARLSRDCAIYENRSVALLRNRQIKGSLGVWLKEVFHKIEYKEILLDSLDIGVALMISQFAKVIQNYGVITVVATRQGKS